MKKEDYAPPTGRKPKRGPATRRKAIERREQKTRLERGPEPRQKEES